MITTMLLFFKNCFILWYLTEEATVDWKSFLGGHFSKNLLLMLSNNSTILAKTFWILIQPVNNMSISKKLFCLFSWTFQQAVKTYANWFKSISGTMLFKPSKTSLETICKGYASTDINVLCFNLSSFPSFFWKHL